MQTIPRYAAARTLGTLCALGPFVGCVPQTELLPEADAGAAGESNVVEPSHGGKGGSVATSRGGAAGRNGATGGGPTATGGAPANRGGASSQAGETNATAGGSGGTSGAAGLGGGSGGDGWSAEIRLSMIPEDGKDAAIQSGGSPERSGLNFGASPLLEASAWTRSGKLVRVRALVAFDLSMIPDNARLEEASLSFGYAPCSAEEDSATGQQFASFSFRRVTEAWREDTVTWNSQPDTTSADEVTASVQQPSGTENLGGFGHGILAMMRSCLADRAHCHGFMVQLITETPHQHICFHSSDSSTQIPLGKPWLTVVYRVPQ